MYKEPKKNAYLFYWIPSLPSLIAGVNWDIHFDIACSNLLHSYELLAHVVLLFAALQILTFHSYVELPEGMIYYDMYIYIYNQ